LSEKDKLRERRSQDKRLFGGNREIAIQRDGEKCVKCGMTREENRLKYGRDITVDHIDGRGVGVPVHLKNNDLSNLMTLCFKCHGTKDGIQSNHAISAVLTREQVRKIRELYATGDYSQNKLAAMYGVTQSNIFFIVRYWTWKKA
jgi:hypothetical protein